MNRNFILKNEKVTKFRCPDKITISKTLQKKKSMTGLEQHGAVWEKTTTSKRYFKINNSSYHSKK